MISALSSQLPEAQIHGAAAGLHLMITFAADFADVDLAAAAYSRGVKVQPLSWHCQRRKRPGLVLGYAASPVSMIEEGISRFTIYHEWTSPDDHEGKGCASRRVMVMTVNSRCHLRAP